ncbi:MAG: sugar kinase, partial [Firmicutes bacterium]|nr:sugar kinase [Bacillota bacterium]
SRLGEDAFGRYIFKTLRGEGVTARVTYDPEHATGLYVKEFVPSRGTSVYYYRRDSAASHLAPGHLQLQDCEGARFVFVTGITAALAESCRAAVFELIAWAREHGVAVVFDPNMRYKLWTESVARPILQAIASQADIVLPGIDEARLLTGCADEVQAADALMSKGPSTVVIKLGERGAYFASAGERGYASVPTVPVVDEVGAGDAFAAGVVSGLLDGLTLPAAARRGCEFGAAVVGVPGDYEGLPHRDGRDGAPAR